MRIGRKLTRVALKVSTDSRLKVLTDSRCRRGLKAKVGFAASSLPPAPTSVPTSISVPAPTSVSALASALALVFALLAGSALPALALSGPRPHRHAHLRHAPAVRPLSALARQGKQIFGNTPQLASAWVGGRLRCTDCHQIDGTIPNALPMFGVAQHYPSFSKRAGHTVTLEQRIQECFVRSENGKPLPLESTQMKALVAYLDYLSDGSPQHKPQPSMVHLPELTGNPVRGKAIYEAQCSSCHQDDGSGIPAAFPPLWGSGAYNDGAGMHRIPVLAAWTQHNMPLNSPGSLTAQQAYDVAAYIHEQPRPKFNPQYKSY